MFLYKKTDTAAYYKGIIEASNHMQKESIIQNANKKRYRKGGDNGNRKLSHMFQDTYIYKLYKYNKISIFEIIFYKNKLDSEFFQKIIYKNKNKKSSKFSKNQKRAKKSPQNSLRGNDWYFLPLFNKKTHNFYLKIHTSY